MTSIFLKKPPEQFVCPVPVTGSQVSLENMFSVHQKLCPLAPTLLAFLRHTGCPFAERDIKKLRAWKQFNQDVQVIAVTHGDIGVRDAWLAEIGGAGALLAVHDTDRKLYGKWGLGYSSALHFMGARSIAGVIRLWLHGIHNRQASGTRWQHSGMFLIRDAQVTWHHIPVSAEAFQLPDEGLLR